ncbi:MAG: bifunctional diaminohydroxyphosphoribosylaminopyrimidine deaminase/5-amino-6-(5-phosphoribosylamino)uracil reductase RibD [Gammaproteobacteria bacterium]|jgi:diaminohydroxyphosphoribosylaminopyrimidine deaminase/5-amino-6-(5-phosphoribosylamino)uracil reductase|nr:bifunctional diaminohydroxyphosphoribosylaminopyrimidine deaminase/5-amino-6-(5-phosphoribosylamino)uracil reductase RibD [Gammaproteobacteria bacterium]MDP7271076.1 bifunctional diaminohydroxyphosphoribosylaminopyrimidine deaminase/5-amino-6-(5-phosphoribosylamino)uracil reductase RibD [Gammaproteobacteria bacterium]HJP04420.1 bifunctional diaminohydroxyphosphoribosylaminopyrimidine deaminase/5-amino-6-(5-phosphoribosylamino)uracil reductase RibD [Gammaproteobacteria bacterium]
MSEPTADDHQHMARALKLAARGVYTTDPNPNVGCIIVASNGDVVGQGWHERAGKLHAEPLALEEAGEAAKGATAYVTLEPCSHHGRTPPCADQLITAGVSRVVYAAEDPNPIVSGSGAQRVIDAGIEVVAGVMAAEADELNRGYVQRMRTGRPWVRCKLAVSVDGRTALASGESKWITGEAARADVHCLRARSSAVLTGIGTVLADDPSLTARLVGDAEMLQPMRVVVDSQLRTPVTAKLFAEESPVQIYHPDNVTPGNGALEKAGATLQAVAETGGHPDLAAVLQDLGGQAINDVLVEAGPTLNGALLDAGLIDEIIVYQAASILGADSRGMFATETITAMSERKELELTDLRKFGSDMRMTYRVLSGEGS